MSKSRSRLAADWFAKLRVNETTQDVEHDDVTNVEATVDAISVTPADVSDQANTSTGYLDLPSGTTAERPSNPNSGYLRYNTTIGSVEFYTGIVWVATNLIPELVSVTGFVHNLVATELTITALNTTDNVTVKFSDGTTTLATVTDVPVTSGSLTVTVPAGVYNATVGTTVSISIENSDGTPSSNTMTKTVLATPDGGTRTISGNTVTHVFTQGTSNFTVPATRSLSNVNILLVGGGGGGGGAFCGGGGAGGIVFAENANVSPDTYSISVGAGGTGGLGWQNVGAMHGSDGGDTTGFNVTASGGGGGSEFSGGSYGTAVFGDTFARVGGCGGGGSSAHSDMSCWQGGASDQQSYSGNFVYGQPGGNGDPASNSSGSYLGGGGGGAGQRGRHYNEGGHGGTGVSFSSYFGTSVGENGYFAGGGGASSQSTAKGNGGTGGGTAGTTNNAVAASGQANTGGGAGAGGYSGANSSRLGGNGGSGVVIVKYAL